MSEAGTSAAGKLIERPPVVEDFLRNFLLEKGLFRTLDTFQQEFYELVQKGVLASETETAVPDAYGKIAKLEDEITQLKREVARAKDAASKATADHGEMKKERDYHRLSHRRILQEKNDLQQEIVRLHAQHKETEEQLAQFKHKYSNAMREKMLTTLHRDRIAQEATQLKATLSLSETGLSRENTALRASAREGSSLSQAHATQQAPGQTASTRGKTQTANATIFGGGNAPSQPANQTLRGPHANDSAFPSDRAPTAEQLRPPPSLKPMTSARARTLANVKTIKAHESAVTCLAFHPQKRAVASVSDDGACKIWGIPDGKIAAEFHAHDSWVASVAFHPQGNILATSSADTTLKLWDISSGENVTTFAEHGHIVWFSDFHHTGDFIASSSMDNTVKIWDLNSVRCRQTLRGHKDSVSSVMFQNYSNHLVTASADKTLCVWDARTGIASQTLTGHANMCNYATYSRTGEQLASCDADGVVKVWEARTGVASLTIDTGAHAANRVWFDASGEVLVVSSNDGGVKLYEARTGSLLSELRDHADRVLDARFDPTGEYLVSAAADQTIRFWS